MFLPVANPKMTTAISQQKRSKSPKTICRKQKRARGMEVTLSLLSLSSYHYRSGGSLLPLALFFFLPSGKVLWLSQRKVWMTLTFWIMIVKGPSIWNPRAKYMTLHQPSTRAKDKGTTSPFMLVSRIAMVSNIREA